MFISTFQIKLARPSCSSWRLSLCSLLCASVEAVVAVAAEEEEGAEEEHFT